MEKYGARLLSAHSPPFTALGPPISAINLTTCGVTIVAEASVTAQPATTGAMMAPDFASILKLYAGFDVQFPNANSMAAYQRKVCNTLGLLGRVRPLTRGCAGERWLAQRQRFGGEFTPS